MNEEAVQALIEKNPKLKRDKNKLLALEPGFYCIHRSWGFGLIQAYQEAENRLIIDFDEKPGHSMDPAFCVNTMEVLPQDHILSRSRTEEDEIKTMVSKQPAEIIFQILDKLPEQKGADQDITRVLKILLGEAKAKKWWTATKKQVAKDSRIGMPVRKVDPYFVRDEPVNREDEVFDAYFKTNAAGRKLRLVEELIAAHDTNEGVKQHLSELIDDFSKFIAETHQLDLLERLHAAWVRDGALTILGRETDIDPQPEELVAQAPILDELANELPGPYQTKLLELVERTHPDSWTKVILDLFKNSRGKFTTESINYLYTRANVNDIKSTLERWLVEQNLKGPVLIWIIKNRNSRKFSTIVHDLVNPRLFMSILYAIDYEALQTSGTRRVPLADLLSDDQELIGDLMAEADPETARDLANSLLMNQGFEELTKKSILARVIKLFPIVQSLVDSSASDEDEENRLFVSQSSYDSRKEEYDELVKEKIPENKKAIAVAREHGDLKENSEYKMARQDQTTLMARKGLLERDLAVAQITDFTEAPTDVVGIGSTVQIENADSNEKVTYHILGAWDSDPDKNVLSYKTPLAQNLLGKEANAVVEVEVAGNSQTWKLKSISRYIDS
ncbi:transcription elongation factor GreA [Opitutia bacterium ISCC 51]|nr:transcription elongation factor GreA [Opitutae bacterium ISCC 51]QXD29044.1 transcription elongation factor GreA [Opitutae bacterium ISCC 52]